MADLRSDQNPQSSPTPPAAQTEGTDEHAPATSTTSGGVLRSIANAIGIDTDRPSYSELLSSLAQRIKGHFHDGGYGWGSYVEQHYKDAVISVHTGSTTAGRAIASETTVTVEFPDKMDLRMEIGPDGFMQKLSETVFRIRDLFPGEDGFEAGVTVQGHPAETVKEILSDPKIQAALMTEPGLMVTIAPDKAHANGILERYLGRTAPDGKRQVILRLGYEVHDVERLERLAILGRSFYDRIDELSTKQA